MNKTSLDALMNEHLERAEGNENGRSAQTVFGGRGKVLRHTLIALLAGEQLSDHPNPGEATVHVLHGRVKLVTEDSSLEGLQGELLEIPQQLHSLEALENSAVLLTIGEHH